MIWNLGSINADNFYRLARLPAAGETIAAGHFHQGLGGKGANMSVAAARGGARVAHIGAVGTDGRWAVDRMMEYGVDTRHISTVATPTGHANINIDETGENNIVLFPGSNAEITEQMIGGALAEASPGDFLLMQNETSGQRFAARTAQTLGLPTVYAAAPFDADAVRAILPQIDILVMNEVEAHQLQEALNATLPELPVAEIVVTLGAEGCNWVSNKSNTERKFTAYKTDVVDTTGAGDTFTGYLVAGLDRGLSMPDAIDLAMRAGALMVSREGTADVIPDLKEIQDHDFS
ncbi:Ribokinase [Sulfitobacter noctilucicola]|uniref:Ribokinase n=1 Tax=Sulfitobacter noctilucicola TaxID=1342301 RepID=A0A7W6M710_9RHOB|nr:ribokinase [Sulfitobacter noctilucicola]KIN62813.1 Ribokinase [Sulfitobacter noctilucicola]MBB4172656.1 ribokinase [Sulfitobacter noctilucicola]